MNNYNTSETAVEHVNEFVGEINKDIAAQHQEFNTTVDKSVEATLDVAQEVTIQTTAIVAPVAETSAYGLSFIAPFTGPAAPELFAASVGLKSIAITAKAVNTAVGGNNFTLTDIAGDLTSLGLSIAIPGAQGLTGAITGEVADRIIDGSEEKKEE